MFTSDDLEAAGRRIAQRHVEPVPLLADIERELGRRKQNARLIGGMAAATVMLVGIGALTLLTVGDDQVQVVAASPVREAAQVLPDRADRGPKRSAGAMVVGAVPSDEGDGLEGDDGDVADDGLVVGVDVGQTSDRSDVEGGDTDRETDEDREERDKKENKKENEEDSKEEDSEEDKKKNGEDSAPDSESEHRFGFDRSGQGLMLFGDWRDGAVFSLNVATGDQAAKLAAAAAAAADDTKTMNGRQVWIDRFDRAEDDRRSRSRDREWAQAVAVSAWIDDGRFMQVSGPSKLEEMLVGLVAAGDGGLWLDSEDQRERFTDRGWLPLPPNVPRIEDWDEIEDWRDLKEFRKDVKKDFEALRKDLEKWEFFDSWDEIKRPDRSGDRDD